MHNPIILYEYIQITTIISIKQNATEIYKRKIVINT